MLSYQHIYHAGNHADLIKHLTLLSVLLKLGQKNKPCTLIDTHAGAGEYDLSATKAQHNNESLTGIGMLDEAFFSQADSALLHAYGEGLYTGVVSDKYCGSAGWMQRYLREQDQAHFCELHPNVYPELLDYVYKSNAHCYQVDGFKQLIALVPPLAKRGIVLVDPPYEQASEYSMVLDVIEKSLRRWATGCYLIWYPMINTENTNKAQAAIRMLKGFNTLADEHSVSNMANIQWRYDTTNDAQGMYGSGIIAINLPWGCDNEISDAMLSIQQSKMTQSAFSLEWIKAPR